MDALRTDISQAYARMAVTFGTRTAVRQLVDSLDPGEVVVDMVACDFASGRGILIVTEHRVLAIRDDMVFRLRAVDLPEIEAVDYAPLIHDGLGVLTAQGRIAVRRMHRTDSDRVVDAILLRVPGAVLGASRPSNGTGKATFEPMANTNPAGATPQAAFDTEPTDFAAPTNALANAPTGPSHDAPAAAPTVHDAAISSPPTAVESDGQTRPSNADLAAGADADAAVLMGVLADLHAKGLLTDDELQAKLAQVSSR